MTAGEDAEAPGPVGRTQRPRRLLFHIRQFGMGGIENVLIGWLHALERDAFSMDVSVGFPTRELDEIYRARIPTDVTVHTLIPRGRLSELHQRRRDRLLGPVGRVALGVASGTWARARIRRELARLAPAYDVVIDFDLTLRKIVSGLDAPVIGVRHFRFWASRTAKARRVGRDLMHYDCVAVLNRTMRDQALALYGDSLPRLRLLPTALDVNSIRQAATQDAPATPDDYVVCVARLDLPAKGQDMLLRAWSRLLSEHPGLTTRLVLVGDGPDRAALETLAKALGLGESVVFAGMQTNPYPWIRRARLLVLASRVEGLPTVILEAMALGCLVVSTDCPVGPREMLEDGNAGLVVPMDDEAALAQAMYRGLSDAPLREACLAVAAGVVQSYDVPAGNARMRGIVDELTGGSPEAR